jgi:hypothetical protein
MLFYLLYDVLSELDGLGFLRVFRYLSTRILAAAITSLIISFLLGPWFIERMKRRQFGQQIRDDGPQTHKKKAGTPTMGGSLILLSLVTATLLWCDLRNQFVWLTLVVTTGFGLIGFADDYLKITKKNTKGLPGKLRLGWEFAIAGSVMVYLFYLGDVLDPSIGSRCRCRSPTSTATTSRCRPGSTWCSRRSSWSGPPTRSTSPTGSTAWPSARRRCAPPPSSSSRTWPGSRPPSW